MLSGVCVGTNDLKRAGSFYDKVLGTIGMIRLLTASNEIGYGSANGPATFWVLTPFDGKSATPGNGTQVMFSTKTKEAVHAFYTSALSLGGEDEGAPGPRNYSPDYYGAYVRDPDGNKLHVSIAHG